MARRVHLMIRARGVDGGRASGLAAPARQARPVERGSLNGPIERAVGVGVWGRALQLSCTSAPLATGGGRAPPPEGQKYLFSWASVQPPRKVTWRGRPVASLLVGVRCCGLLREVVSGRTPTILDPYIT